jgi:hypothetical protein
MSDKHREQYIICSKCTLTERMTVHETEAGNVYFRLPNGWWLGDVGRLLFARRWYVRCPECGPPS